MNLLARSLIYCFLNYIVNLRQKVLGFLPISRTRYTPERLNDNTIQVGSVKY